MDKLNYFILIALMPIPPLLLFVFSAINNRACLYSVGCGFSETCCFKKSSTREWSDILLYCLFPCVEFFLSTALSGIDNSLHDGEAVKQGVISQGIGREFCGNTHLGDKMRKAAGKTPVQ